MVTFFRFLEVPPDVASGEQDGYRVALKIAYDGHRFDGFARQPQERFRTVEGAVLGVLTELGAVEGPAEAGLRPGSRTDRGVSARENVVVLRSRIPAGRLPGALVGRVPGLWPLAAVEVEPGFDPRWARWREYRYFLAREELAGPGAGELERVLRVFVGRHDFSAFAKREPHRSPVREILDVRVEKESSEEGLVGVRVRGASFLWQQVRRMVASALAVGRGEASLEEVRRLLSDPVRPAPWGVASASRLVLWRVHDPRLGFRTPRRLRDRLREEWVGEWADAMAGVRFLEGVRRSLQQDPGEGSDEKGTGPPGGD